jgi:hypothetical protein
LLAGCEQLPDDGRLKHDLATARIALDAAASEGLNALKGALIAADQAIHRAVSDLERPRADAAPSGTLSTAAVPVARRPAAGQKALVRDVQSDLARLGYYAGPIDGFAGPHTLSAVQRYQVDHGLDADGWVTKDLAAHISSSRTVAER